MSLEFESSWGWGRKWPAPAKINLMLRIIGRRADGYHLLQTVFQFIELSDWLSFYPVNDSSVKLRKTLPGVVESDDLTVRAAKLLQMEAGCRLGVEIAVEKNLPMGGGLGGGSSDAATVLLVLNRLWGLNLSVERLMALGLSLGADVPVFVFGYAAWGEGVGENLTKIDLKEQWVVIIKPDCHVNTKQIFSSDNLTRDSKSITIDDFIAGQHNNDCLQVVCEAYPQVRQALADLSVYAEARLTGTGACVYALFGSEEQAQFACQALSANWHVYVSRCVNESPLLSSMRVGANL